MPSSNQINRVVPIISTGDIQKSISYYIDVLGFLFDFKHGDPIIFAGVKAGSAEIYFTYNPHMAKFIKEQNFSPEIFIWIPDAIRLFKEHVDKGAEIFEPISDGLWGTRQYVIKEINGYHLKFAQVL